MVDDIDDVSLCTFVDGGVRCPHGKLARRAVLVRCFSCSVYRDSERRRVEQEEDLLDEIEEEHRTGVLK